MNIHEKYMSRCIQLAKKGLGSTYPNPLVGCVIVHKNKIIGEGWHEKAGEAHAEVRAIASVKNHELLKESQIYVSLEPCSHYGKTPPCANLIIDKKIPEIIIGAVDPFAEVSGNGIKKLFEAGRKVRVGVLEKECLDLNKRFNTFHQKKRPYIILKWAETPDSFVAPKTQDGIFWISNPYSKQMVHKWRSEEVAIIVGTNTALKDNPQLNTRSWSGKSPIRIVIDKNLKLTEDLHLFDASVQTYIFHHLELNAKDKKNLNYIGIDFSKNVLNQLMEKLYQLKIQSVIIEGGSQTLQSFIDQNLWDEARVFTGQNKLNNGIKAPKFDFTPILTEKISTDIFKTYRND
ncbi:bifunctional diaminohydroxyphosphoribosylaminopyrimidine deaminase/5-amino-6-(5-phosphoribosylamino)uracil reductase RibD [Psychroflexus halocasei]|uniref:Riboflavin biosynthesis protein RibD n=1 Tax=Psychroflexus halocasei TaxID=908615 RepID=A0A1H3WJP9_9FLAO|nr:bifunctional diaminohydroxyphosphoribosylaminopyrimidine deaminase/5-amino-6-(5-phosphoribosylamino)uracil reductase RibD [Psychroflexus halocasei]SDZ87031.1 diaminohydroxyphosphoribosylaminopyrimidine deaminase / 5-amino-6-(5-phosphoribosylamino)uracil reductase [Psychroflexus halocasei]